jgi:hypothetical protein
LNSRLAKVYKQTETLFPNCLRKATTIATGLLITKQFSNNPWNAENINITRSELAYTAIFSSALTLMTCLTDYSYFSDARPYFKINRLEQRDHLTPVQEVSNSSTFYGVRNLDLISNSKYQAGAYVNFFKYIIPQTDILPIVKAGLDFGILQTHIDSVNNNPPDMPQRVTSWYFAPTFSAILYNSRHIYLEANHSFMFTDMLGKDLNNNSSFITYKSGDVIHKTGIEVSFFPDSYDHSSWIFLRGMLFINRDNNGFDRKQEEELRLQIGYAKSF